MAAAVGGEDDRFTAVIDAVIALYAGQWPNYAPCRTGYHHLGHAVDVALAALRMAVGRNRAGGHTPIGRDEALPLLTAALFHDAGYILRRGDDTGNGGKYSFSHVPRGCAMFEEYARAQGWPAAHRRAVIRIIEVTDFATKTTPAAFADAPALWPLAAIVGTADLVAQMSDLDYIRNINKLFDEFNEAYQLCGDEVERLGIRRYASVDEMRSETIDFYRQVVLPRIEAFGNMHRYLGVYFAAGRNPYMENIIANLSAMGGEDPLARRRIGDVLCSLGYLNPTEIEAALGRQEGLCGENGAQDQCKELGSILVDMGVLTLDGLSRGLVHQAVPEESLAALDAAATRALLRFSVVLHQVGREPWAVELALRYIEEMLACAGVAVLVPGTNGAPPAVLAATPAAGHRATAAGGGLGLSEWVFRHQRPVMIHPHSQYGLTPSPAAIGSILAAPIFVQGRVRAVAECYDKKDGAFTSLDRHVLTLALNILAASLPQAVAAEAQTP